MFAKIRSLCIFTISACFLVHTVAYADSRALKSASHDGEKRVAIVIGNSDYASAPLKNPANDAKLVADSLRKLKFKVYDYYNLNLNDIKRVTDTFDKEENSGGTALFYFAGHGMQSGGSNYLIPVNADIKGEGDIEFEAMNLNRVLSKMESANNRVNIVILDACRNNPFARSYRSASAGLATVDAPLGSFIAYATAPGKVASDGKESNGLFTSAFVDVLNSTAGITIEQLFKYVRSNVRISSDGEQIPWTSSSMEGDFFFSPSDKPIVKLQQQAPPKKEVNISSAGIDTFNEQYTGMVLNKIPAGCFMMGSQPQEKHADADETPLHRVCLGEYYLGIHEVTQQQWAKVMGYNPSTFQQCGADCPVENVSWDDATSFAKKLSKITGKSFRLPTEAEWEYAAKEGGKVSVTPAELNAIAWHSGNSSRKSHPAGRKEPNGFGIYDMLGNVQEWCSDNYEFGYYSFSPLNNPKGAEDTTRKTLRGGSWIGDEMKVRLTNRRGISSYGTGPYIGFRLVMTD
jgi:formylglycine-generating enzyme required for sulfatase activity